jgi:hypothetical protein
MIDLSNPAQWNLVFRRDLVAGNTRIPTQTFVTNAQQVFVGILVPDNNWYRGGYLTQYLPALPSSTNDLFTALTQVSNYPLTCRNYQIIELLTVQPSTSVCTIVLPPYFKQCKVEVFDRNDV